MVEIRLSEMSLACTAEFRFGWLCGFVAERRASERRRLPLASRLTCSSPTTHVHPRSRPPSPSPRRPLPLRQRRRRPTDHSHSRPSATRPCHIYGPTSRSSGDQPPESTVPSPPPPSIPVRNGRRIQYITAGLWRSAAAPLKPAAAATTTTSRARSTSPTGRTHRSGWSAVE